jgi:hypothetical protein
VALSRWPARSLRPLVKARAFGMTQQREFQTEALPEPFSNGLVEQIHAPFRLASRTSVFSINLCANNP